jgi:hypothetical protein
VNGEPCGETLGPTERPVSLITSVQAAAGQTVTEAAGFVAADEEPARFVAPVEPGIDCLLRRVGQCERQCLPLAVCSSPASRSRWKGSNYSRPANTKIERQSER